MPPSIGRADSRVLFPRTAYTVRCTSQPLMRLARFYRRALVRRALITARETPGQRKHWKNCRKTAVIPFSRQSQRYFLFNTKTVSTSVNHRIMSRFMIAQNNVRKTPNVLQDIVSKRIPRFFFLIQRRNLPSR